MMNGRPDGQIPLKPHRFPVRGSKSFGWAFWVVTAVTLLVVTRPVVIRSAKKAPLTDAVSHARQIGLALFEFETEYGAFPNEETRTKVGKKNKTGLDLSGTSSNALFRQLFAARITQSEDMFYAELDGIRKPDGDISKGKALVPGEVAFGYVAGLTTAGNPARVVAFCPIIPGTDRFDPEPFDGFTVALRIDNSVGTFKINEAGYAMVGGGKTLFETGDDTIWGQHVPDIRYPEFPTSKPSLFHKLFSK